MSNTEEKLEVKIKTNHIIEGMVQNLAEDYIIEIEKLKKKHQHNIAIHNIKWFKSQKCIIQLEDRIAKLSK